MVAAELHKAEVNDRRDPSACYASQTTVSAEQPFSHCTAQSAERPIMPQISKAAATERVLTAAAVILTTSNTNDTDVEDDNDNHDPLYIPDSDDDILVINEDKRDYFSEEETYRI